jgi:uncharacterized protein involved in exopolysaccharide biosynthesis
MDQLRQTMGPGPEDQTDAASVFDLPALGSYIGFVLKSAGRHKLVFVVCLLTVAGGAAALARIFPNRYQVEGTVLVQPGSIIGSLANPGLNRDWDLPTRAARELVIRRDNLLALCKKTNFLKRHLAARTPLVLARDWLFDKIRSAPLEDETRLRGLVEGIERKLFVTVGGEGTVTLRFVWSDPSLAYDFVDAALQSYFETRRAAEITQVGESIAILQAHAGQVQRQATELAASIEERERATRRASGPRRIVAPPVPVTEPSTPEQDEEAQQLEIRFRAKRQALADLEEFRRRRMDDLQAKLSELRHVYAPEHPQVIDLQKSIDGLSGSSPQLDQLRAEVNDLQASLKRISPLRAAVVNRPPLPQPYFDPVTILPTDDPRVDYDRVQLLALNRQYQSLSERIDAARVEIDTAEAAFKYRYIVVTPPQMPHGPMRPYALMVVVVGLMGGVLFAFFATTTMDLFRGRVVERWQVERALGLTVIAEVDR